MTDGCKSGSGRCFGLEDQSAVLIPGHSEFPVVTPLTIRDNPERPVNVEVNTTAQTRPIRFHQQFRNEIANERVEWTQLIWRDIFDNEAVVGLMFVPPFY